MPTSIEYRAKAAECLAHAGHEMDPRKLLEFTNLARSYLRLAQYAERQLPIDMAYETPAQSDRP